MLAEAMKALFDLCEKAAGSSVIHDDKTTKKVRVGTEVLTIEREKPGRHHKANSLESITGYCSEQSVIWHAGDTVVLVVDDGQRLNQDLITWSLAQSSKFGAVSGESAKPRDHKSFVAFIVKHLRDEFERDSPGLLGTLRSLKFATNDESEGNLQMGKESMGRNVQREVLGATELPETVTLQLRRWAELDIIVRVECLLVVDLEKRTLALDPLADSIVNANLKAHYKLGEMIREEVDCNVYHGVY